MVICSCCAQNSAGGHEWNCPNNLSSNPMTPEQIGRMMAMQPTHESEELARLRAENAELRKLLADVRSDLVARAEMGPDDGGAVLNISNGLLIRIDAAIRARK